MNPRETLIWVLNETVGSVLPVHFIPSDDPLSRWDWVALIVVLFVLIEIAATCVHQVMRLFQ